MFFFFCDSLQCFGSFVVDEAEGPASCAAVDSMRLCKMGATAVLATKLSIRLSLSSNPVAQETRIAKPPSRQHKVVRQLDYVSMGIPAGVTGVQTEVRGDQVVVGCSRKVHILLESFTSFRQRCRILTHAKTNLSAPLPRGAFERTTSRPLDEAPRMRKLSMTGLRFRNIVHTLSPSES